MELKILTKKEFDSYALNHPLGSFQQSSAWGKFMEDDNFHAYYVGGFVKDNIVAVTMLLSYESKQVNGRIFYAPRGFLIDYKNDSLLKSFTNCIKNFILEKHGVFLRIDPYVLVCDRDNNGNIIKGGISNDFIKSNLTSASFIKSEVDIQPKWLNRINLKGKSIDDIFTNFSSKARQIIRKNEKLGFKVRDLSFDNLDSFLRVIDNESKKYNILIPTRSFYEDLRNSFTSEYVKFKEVYFEKEEIIKNINIEINNAISKKEERIRNYHNSKMTDEYFIKKEFDYRKEINRLNNLKEYFNTCDAIVSMGYYLYITISNEVIAFQGGILPKYSKLNASYTMHYEMIKYAINNKYKYYNLYEIGDITNKNNKLINSFNYKKNFGGEVVELIGTYDLIIDEKKWMLAKKYFPKYLGVKTIFK